MSVFNPVQSVTPGLISCVGTVAVTLEFDAEADLSSDPTDIILVLDRSSSMSSPKMEYAKSAAKQFISIVADASGSFGSSFIQSGCKVGIVSFADDAQADVPLTDRVTVLNSSIDALVPKGTTNHEAAFLAAEQMLPPKGQNRQIVIVLSDGVSYQGGDPSIITQRMKNTGVEIYCIGLSQDRTQMDVWASAPVSTHVTTDSDPQKLGQMFEQIASEVVLAGAHTARIVETINPDFKITRIGTPSAGTIAAEDDRGFTWDIGTAGLSKSPQKVTLSFEIMHTVPAGGIKHVSQSIIYSDREGTVLPFPSPALEVQCQRNTEFFPGPCPAPTEFTILGCKDAAHASLTDTALSGLGRIVQVNVTLKAICPGKRVAASIILMELAPDGSSLPRGVKHILVPAQTGNTCQDITLRCIRFSLPEALDAAGRTDSVCNSRQFTAQVLANYVDTDFTCCDVQTPIL